jgi:hypothetical protein
VRTMMRTCAWRHCRLATWRGLRRRQRTIQGGKLRSNSNTREGRYRVLSHTDWHGVNGTAIPLRRRYDIRLISHRRRIRSTVGRWLMTIPLAPTMESLRTQERRRHRHDSRMLFIICKSGGSVLECAGAFLHPSGNVATESSLRSRTLTEQMAARPYASARHAAVGLIPLSGRSMVCLNPRSQKEWMTQKGMLAILKHISVYSSAR